MSDQIFENGENLPEPEDVNTISLERIRLIYAQVIGKYFVNEPVIDLSLNPNEIFMKVVQQQASPEELERAVVALEARIKLDVVGQTLKALRVEYPKTWWDAFKKRWFSKWMLDRWPVEMERVELIAEALFHEIKLPDAEYYIRLRSVHWDPYKSDGKGEWSKE